MILALITSVIFIIYQTVDEAFVNLEVVSSLRIHQTQMRRVVIHLVELLSVFVVILVLTEFLESDCPIRLFEVEAV